LFPALAVKVYLAICVEWAKDHCAVGLTSIIWPTVDEAMH